MSYKSRSIKRKKSRRAPCKHGRKQTGKKGCKKKPGPKRRASRSRRSRRTSRSRGSRRSRRSRRASRSRRSCKSKITCKSRRSCKSHSKINGGGSTNRRSCRRTRGHEGYNPSKFKGTQL